MEKLLRNKTAIALFVLPAFIIYCAIVIIPIFVSSWYSLLKWDGVGKSVFNGLQNFVELFARNTDGFWASVKNSGILAALSVFIQLPLAMLIALTLAWGVRGEQFFRKVYFLPVIISTVVICQLWVQIYNLDYGLLNGLLRAVGLKSWAQPWLSQPRTALPAVFLPIVWQYVGYHMLLYYTAIKSLPDEIFDSARIDGASFAQTAIRITIPLIRAMIRVSLIFAIVGSFKLFDHVYIMTYGGPMQATEVPSTLMYKTIFRKYAYGYGSGMSVFIILECFLFTLIVQRGLRSREG
jgi:raffinose/stachyose/melibiose transport system permease protein